MMVSRERLRVISDSTGFRIDVVEKVVHLLNLLNVFNSHPVLKGKLALKGGTALNLFIFNIPRFSVDIDLNYIGTLDRKEMLADQPKVLQAMQAVFQREGFNVKHMPTEHAGGKWRLKYKSFNGDMQNLEVDLNFAFRQPLWDVSSHDSKRLGIFQAQNIPIFNVYELFAGKLAALFSRRQARDIFDVHQLLNWDKEINQDNLRLAFIVYGAMNRKDWRTISLDDIEYDANELKQKLFPVFQNRLISSDKDIDSFGKNLVEECHSKLSIVFPFTEQEIKFLNRVLDDGEIDPALLTSDEELKKRIRCHPALLWKALNIRKRFGK